MIYKVNIRVLITSYITAYVGTEGKKGSLIQRPEDLNQFVNKLSDGSGLFICTICQKTLGYRHLARNHVESIHFPDSFIYECDYCGKELNSKKAKINHVYNVHKNLFIHECDYCGKELNSKKAIINHVYKVHKNRDAV